MSDLVSEDDNGVPARRSAEYVYRRVRGAILNGGLVVRDRVAPRVPGLRCERQLRRGLPWGELARREYVYPIMEMSADHDRFGGGSLRR